LLAEARRTLTLDGDTLRTLARKHFAARRLEEARSCLVAYHQFSPHDAESQMLLGFVAVELGRWTQARDAYHRALALRPDAPTLRNDLAWLLATCPLSAVRQPDEAVRLAEAGCVDGKPSADALDTLAAAYASAGRFDKAVEMARRALSKSSGLAETRDAIAFRVELYANNRPYRSPVP
jgi:Flp pilus assembly protein TadD